MGIIYSWACRDFYGKEMCIRDRYLYDASLSLISSGKDTLDVKKMRIGIRELEYELSAYEDSSPIVRLNYNPTAALQDGKPAFDTVKPVSYTHLDVYKRQVIYCRINFFDWRRKAIYHCGE